MVRVKVGTLPMAIAEHNWDSDSDTTSYKTEQSK